MSGDVILCSAALFVFAFLIGLFSAAKQSEETLLITHLSSDNSGYQKLHSISSLSALERPWLKLHLWTQISAKTKNSQINPGGNPDSRSEQFMLPFILYIVRTQFF